MNGLFSASYESLKLAIHTTILGESKDLIVPNDPSLRNNCLGQQSKASTWLNLTGFPTRANYFFAIKTIYRSNGLFSANGF